MIDRAQFVRDVQRAYLFDAKRGVWNFDRATPAALQPLIHLELAWTASARAVVEQVAREGWWKSVSEAGWSGTWYSALSAAERMRVLGAISAQADRLQGRLQYYLSVVDDCIARGRASDPRCCYDEVTNPLLWGWFGASYRDGGSAIACRSSEPCVQRLADVSGPFNLLVAAAEMDLFTQEQGFSAFMNDVGSSGRELLKAAAPDPRNPFNWLALGLIASAATVAFLWVYGPRK